MENLHPVAQVATIIMVGLVFIVYFISMTDSWKDILRKK